MVPRLAPAIQCKSHTGILTRLLQFMVVSGFLLLCLLFMLASLTKPASHPEITAAEIAARIRNLHFYTVFWQITCAATVAVGLVTVLLVGGVHVYRQVKQGAIQLYKLGEHQEIRVHERDLSLAWPTVLGLISAQQLQQINGGLDRALELYGTLSDVQSRQLRALAGLRGLSAPGLASSLGADAALPGPIQPIPTFADLLQRGEIAPGSLVIFGFHKATGQPERGPLHELYSTILIGLSGFGKTTCLAYLVAASMLAEDARFTVLDVHYPAPESLGAALGPLVRHPALTLVSNPLMLEEPLQAVEQTLDDRLASGHTAFPPLVLVVDEHERWATHVHRLVALELRIIQEGRKVKVYLFLTTKSAKADKIGDSALRDNMVSSYVFKTKPHNARTFFKDRDKAALLGQVTDVGEAIFTNRKDDSHVVKLPFASPEDMQTVVERLAEACDAPTKAAPDPPRRSRPDRLTPTLLKQQRQRLGLSLQEIVDRSALKNKMQLSRFEHGTPTLSDEEQRQVLHTLFPPNGSGRAV